MQVIKSNFLTATISENGAQLVHLLDNADHDYIELQDGEAAQLYLFEKGKEQNVLADLPWTVVDKGDARVSLMAIDDEQTRRFFPYHFEYMITCRLLGNQLRAEMLLTNNSQRDFSCSLACQLNINEKQQLKLEAADFPQKEKRQNQVRIKTDILDVAAGAKRKVAFTLTALS